MHFTARPSFCVKLFRQKTPAQCTHLVRLVSLFMSAAWICAVAPDVPAVPAPAVFSVGLKPAFFLMWTFARSVFVMAFA